MFRHVVKGLPLVAAVALVSLALASSVRAQTLYALNNGDGSVSRISPTGIVSNLSLNGGIDAEGLTVDSSGNLYVSYGDGFIRKFDSTGNTLFTWSGGDIGPLGPYDLALDRAGNLFVANANSDTIGKITPTGEYSTFASDIGLNGPYCIALDAADNVYVSNFDSTISKFDSAGNNLAFSLTGDSVVSPGELACDASGNVYVIDSGANISKITASGVVSSFAIGDPQDFLNGLAFDLAGNLYSAGIGGNTVYKFDSLGNAVSFPLSGDSLSNPVNVAFAPSLSAAAPEPGAFALLATGLLPLVGVARRRKIVGLG